MAAPSARARWLFGPGPDLLLGCGGAYALVFAALALAPGALQAAFPFWVLPLLILVTGIPHYGATLLRVYDRREERAAYRVFAVWATLAVYAWFAFGVYDVAVGSWLVTLYLTWSPWHYTGQNYGLAVMFLRRRGVDVAPEDKRLLYASFVLSYATAFLGSHAAVATATYAPVTLAGSSYRFLRLGIPETAYAVLLPLAVAGQLACLALAVRRLRRAGPWRDLGPALALAGLQALWFSIPVVARATGLLAGLGPFDPELAAYAFLWIAIGHSVQYLWVTTYYATAVNRAEPKPRYLLRTWLAGGAIWGIPLLVFAPDVLGVRAFDAGLGLLVAAAVNIHHFILDGAIWKLRDGRIARILLRSRDAEPVGGLAASRRPAWAGLARAGVAVAGLAYAGATVFGTLEFEYGVRRASDPPDFARLQLAAERLRWVGRDHPDVRYDLGVHDLREGDLAAARREIERSLALGPQPHTFVALGLLEQRSRRWPEALAAFQAALALDPDDVAALHGSAQEWLRRGEPERARRALERAVALAPERADLRERLGRL
jgi:tetratricopeptide (TPR) repeat protein